MVGEPQHRHGWLCWRRLTPSRGGRSSEVKPSPRRLGDFFGVFEFSSFFGDVYFLGVFEFFEFFEFFQARELSSMGRPSPALVSLFCSSDSRGAGARGRLPLFALR